MPPHTKQAARHTPAPEQKPLTVKDLSPESRRQLEAAILEAERDEKPVPFRDMLRELREGRTT